MFAFFRMFPFQFIIRIGFTGCFRLQLCIFILYIRIQSYDHILGDRKCQAENVRFFSLNHDQSATMELCQRTGKSQTNTRTCSNLSLFFLAKTDKRLKDLLFHLIRNDYSVVLSHHIESLLFLIYFQLYMHITISILHPII